MITMEIWDKVYKIDTTEELWKNSKDYFVYEELLDGTIVDISRPLDNDENACIVEYLTEIYGE